MKTPGEQFLHQKEPGLHTSKPVEYEQKRRKAAGQEISQKPAEKISAWLEVIKRTHTGHRDDPRVLERIKDYYHREYIIKPEDVPEAVFLLEQRIAREEGHGKIEITDEFREQKRQQIITDQKASLDRWVDYLSSEDAAYPIWAKYWAFTSILKMGRFEKVEKEQAGEKNEFGRFINRTKDTVASFPTLNPRALAMTIGAMQSRLEQKQKPKKEQEPVENFSVKLDNPAFQELLSTENFSKLYAQFLIEMPEYSTKGLQETRGKWVKYKKGSDPKPLVDSLEGYPLEWCTANIDTARTQLAGGDFYVYYSINEAGEAIIPRLAIRMQDNRIAENPRGIAPGQNLDPYINEVLENKLNEFPDKEKFKKKSADMKQLTAIEKRKNSGEKLTTDDLRFLYQLDSKIQGFGYGDDPRIQEIRDNRDIKSDLSLITGYSKEQISTTKDEALFGGIKFHYGDLDLGGLKSAEGLVLPETIGGNLYLGGLQSAEGLVLPETMGGDLYLGGLQSAKGLVLPKTMGGYLDLSGLQSDEGLVLPETIGGNLYLSRLRSAEGLVLPETIGGNLYLGGLQSAEGLVLPETIGGNLYLGGLQSAEGLILPETMGGDLNLGGLRSAEGLVLPETIGGYLNLGGLRSAEGLVLPETIGGDLYLGGLRSAEGLKLPETVGGDLYLNGLQSAEGLVLPETIGGYLYLGGLKSAEREGLKIKYPKLNIY